MSNDYTIMQGAGSQARPSRSAADGFKLDARMDRYGNLAVVPFGKPRLALADEGSYYTLREPTTKTAVVGIAAANGDDDTEAFFYLRNPDSATKRVYLDYIKMQAVAVGTNGTSTTYISKMDSGSDRYSSGGALTSTPANSDMSSDETSSLVAYAGAVVLDAASAAVRVVGSGQLRSVIKVAGDQYLFDFGGDPSLPDYETTTGTAIAHIRVAHQPVVLGAGDAFHLQINGASQSVGASFTFEIGFWER